MATSATRIPATRRTGSSATRSSAVPAPSRRRGCATPGRGSTRIGRGTRGGSSGSSRGGSAELPGASASTWWSTEMAVSWHKGKYAYSAYHATREGLIYQLAGGRFQGEVLDAKRNGFVIFRADYAD